MPLKRALQKAIYGGEIHAPGGALRKTRILLGCSMSRPNKRLFSRELKLCLYET